jgi:alpha-1,2-mannosyltransferase
VLRRLSSRVGPRAAVLITTATLLASILGTAVLDLSDRHVYLKQTDTLVYRAAGSWVWGSHAGLYDQLFGPFHLRFTYPPFAALLFALGSWLPLGGWQIVFACLDLACLFLVARASLTLGGAKPSIEPVCLLVAVSLWLEPVAMTAFFGQINLLVLALILVDLARPHDRYRGIGVGIAAGLKLTPLIFIPYLILTGQRRSAGIAGASFVATIGVALILRPHDSLAFWGGDLFRPGDTPSYLLNQSLNGTIQRSVHSVTPAHLLWACAAVVVCAAGLLAAVRAERMGATLAATLTCGVTGLLISPVSWSHHYVWVVPFLALAFCPSVRRSARRTPATFGIVVGMVTLAVAGWWPSRVGADGGFPPGVGIHPAGLLRLATHNLGRELHWPWYEKAIGNLYVIAALAWIIVVLVRYRSSTAREVAAFSSSSVDKPQQWQ